MQQNYMIFLLCSAIYYFHGLFNGFVINDMFCQFSAGFVYTIHLVHFLNILIFIFIPFSCYNLSFLYIIPYCLNALNKIWQFSIACSWFHLPVVMFLWSVSQVAYLPLIATSHFLESCWAFLLVRLPYLLGWSKLCSSSLRKHNITFAVLVTRKSRYASVE